MGVLLLVEDDEAERYVWRKTAKRFNHEVVVVSNGELALMILQADDAIVALITDIRLGAGMTGRDLAKAARELRPNLPILFITGFGPADSASMPAPVLMKPYTDEALLKAMRTLLG